MKIGQDVNSHAGVDPSIKAFPVMKIICQIMLA